MRLSSDSYVLDSGAGSKCGNVAPSRRKPTPAGNNYRKGNSVLQYLRVGNSSVLFPMLFLPLIQKGFQR